MIFDEDQILLRPDGTEFSNEMCSNFDSYCFTLTMSKDQPLFAHRLLSRAKTLVPEIIRAQHPRTLACFLEVCIHLIQAGNSRVALSLLELVQRESRRIITTCHPWVHVCRLLGQVDLDTIEEALTQVWKCNVDTFGEHLGHFNRLAMAVRLDYMKRVYGITEPRIEEQLLCKLSARVSWAPRQSTPRVMLNLAHNMNRQGCYDRAKSLAQKILLFLENRVFENYLLLSLSPRRDKKSRAEHTSSNIQIDVSVGAMSSLGT